MSHHGSGDRTGMSSLLHLIARSFAHFYYAQVLLICEVFDGLHYIVTSTGGLGGILGYFLGSHETKDPRDHM